MKTFKRFGFLAVFGLALTVGCGPPRVAIGIGGPPICPYGYYEMPPYACAPDGYYGPEWFNGGIFIGAGPWYHGRRGSTAMSITLLISARVTVGRCLSAAHVPRKPARRFVASQCTIPADAKRRPVEDKRAFAGNMGVIAGVKASMFEQASFEEPRNVLGDWILRGFIGLGFVAIGWEKFPTGPGSWVKFFDEVGFGQGFRYFTGIVEIAGGVLVLIPWTVTAGLALLACTMASAALILTFILGRPADSVFSGALFALLVLFWRNRRS